MSTARGNSASNQGGALNKATKPKRKRRRNKSLLDGEGPRGGRLAPSRVTLDSNRMANHAIALLDAFAHVIEPIEAALERSTGAPRTLSVKALLVLMFVSGRNGTVLLSRMTEEANSLDRDIRERLGLIRYRQGDEVEITDRQISYLFHLANDFLLLETPEETEVDEATGLWVDTTTGAVLDYREEADIEDMGNEFLFRLWKRYGIPLPSQVAVDSYPIPTHETVKSMGGLKYVDIQALHRACPPTKKASGTSAKLRVYYQEWAKEHRHDALAAGMPDGPVVPVKTKGKDKAPRMAEGFPWTDRFGRLHHNLDGGAGDTYRGGGTIRSGGPEYGRDHHSVVSVGDFPNGNYYPPLPLGYSARMGNHSGTEAGLKLICDVQDAGAPITQSFLDRGYTYDEAKALKIPLAERGITVVGDLHETQRGSTVIQPGVLNVDGWLHTSGIPKHLIELPNFTYSMTADDRASLALRYDERLAFAFRPMGRDSKTGRMRFRGPARVDDKPRGAGGKRKLTGATARCVNSPHFSRMDRSLPQTTCKRGVPCHCSKTISLMPDDLPSNWEPLHYGSTMWLTTKGLRSPVESYNAFAQYHAQVDAHAIRVSPRAWHFANFARVVGMFIQQAFNWFKQLGLRPNAESNEDPMTEEAIAPLIAFLKGAPPPGEAAAA